MKLSSLLMVAVFASVPAVAHGDFIVNFGETGGANAPTAVGPDGTATNAVIFATSDEDANVGNLQTFTGTSFAALPGTVDVGVQVSFPNAGNNNVRRSVNRGTPAGVSNFFSSWIGSDLRDQPAAADGTEVPVSIVLDLTGLAANSVFQLTTYHADSGGNLTGPSFSTSIADSNGNTTGFDFFDDAEITAAGGAVNIGNTFSLTTDSAGAAAITFTAVDDGGGAAFFGLNGFQLTAVPVAVPEPSSLAILLVASVGLVARRRR